MQLCQREDAKYVTIKNNKTETKFKLRLATYLITHVVKDKTKAKKIASSFPPGLPKKVVA